MQLTPTMTTTAAPAPVASTIPTEATGRIAALDLSAPLQPLPALDVIPDGKLTVQDAGALEFVAGINRTAAQGADPASSARLLDTANQLDFAAQQARYGAALLADGPIPNSTVHNLIPTAPFSSPTTPASLIERINSVDVERLVASGVKPVATFDVDGTSIKGDIFLPFTERMAREGRFDERANEIFRSVLAKVDADPAVVAANDANANALLMVSKTDPKGKVDTPTMLANVTSFFAVGDAIVGHKLDDLRGVGKRLLAEGSGSNPPSRLDINDDSAAPGDSVPDVTAALSAKGITPHIVTWGFDFLASEAAPYLGIDPKHVVGTHVSSDENGLVTGHDGRTIASKDIMVRRSAGSPPVFAFGDTSTDLTMLDQAVARGVVVNPTESMRQKMAERNGALGEVRYSSTVGELAAKPAAG